MNMRRYLPIALLLLAPVTSAQADADPASAATPNAPPRWLVLPVLTTSNDLALDAQRLTAPFEAALRKAGQEAVTSFGAAAQFEQSHSAEPVKLDDDEMSRLLRRVGEAARHLALGELVQAQQAMEGVNALSGPARDFLNREAARARKIFDNCLVAAYLWERGNEHQRAVRQMLDCSRSFPGFRPEGRAYPPEMRELFDEATARIGQMQSTTLLVQSTGRLGCGVRLNGIEVGRSPMSFSDVRSGATRVQLECDEGLPGRIHAIELAPGDNQLLIDPDFDRAVHTRSALWLEYLTDGERARRDDDDARSLAKALRIDRAVTLRVLIDARQVRVSVRPLWGAAPVEVTELAFDIEQGYDPALVSATVAALLRRVPEPPLEGRDPQVAGAASQTQPSAAIDGNAGGEPSDTASSAPPSLAVGVPLAVVGASGVVAGWVLYAGRQDTRRALYPSGVPLAEVDSFYNAGTASLLLSGAGAAVLTASEYFWLPNQREVPTWAWGVGAAGVALGLTGAGFALLGEHCEIADARVGCQGFTADKAFGATLLFDSLPLLGVPITYFLRRALDSSHTQLAVHAHDGQAALTLKGRF